MCFVCLPRAERQSSVVFSRLLDGWMNKYNETVSFGAGQIMKYNTKPRCIALHCIA